MMSVSPAAQAVPTSTGTTAAGSVRRRAPATHTRQPVGGGGVPAAGRAWASAWASASVTTAGWHAARCAGNPGRWHHLPVRRLVVVEARGTDAVVDRLRRAWDDGDAVLPLDPRLPGPARDRVLAAARPDE